MLRFLVRALGFVALAWAFAAAVMDGASSIANSRIAVTSLGATLMHLAPGRYTDLQAGTKQISPFLWDSVLIHVLSVPTFVMLAFVGLALMALASLGQKP